jgi:hypothetical protein
VTNEEETFEGRREQSIVVKHYEFGKNLDTTDGWGWTPPEVVGMETIVAGDTLTVEMKGSRITGVKAPGEDWIYHDSDQTLAQQMENFKALRRQSLEEQLREHQVEWYEREQALPEDLQDRIKFFRQNGGLEFDIDGWSYELIVCELVVLYREADRNENGTPIDSEAVNEYARLHGTTGHQHETAKMMVIAQDAMTSVDFPAALRPLGATYDRPSGA